MIKIIIPLVYIALIATADAAPPAGETANPALHAWFESLRQPGSKEPCCSIADCRFTVAERQGNQFKIAIDGWPYIAPAPTILPGMQNPTGRAIVCYKYIAFNPPLPADAPSLSGILCEGSVSLDPSIRR